MMKFARSLSIGLSLFALAGACKILPNSVRSGVSQQKVDAMLDTSSIQFARKLDQKSGSLSFTLKDEHNCRIEYWARDPSGMPPPASPLSIDCPEDQLALAQSIDVTGITPGFPLNFRIYVWPKTMTFLSHFVKEFAEGEDVEAPRGQDLVVVRYIAPRQSAEIYAFKASNSLAVADIKAKLHGATATSCEEKAEVREIPFARNNSLEDAQKRPLAGLSAVRTEGFGSGEALVHPFFSSRLIESYEQIARQENWIFNFAWESKPYSFESFPPGYIGTLNVGDGSRSKPVTTRALAGTLETIELTANKLQLEPRILFPTDVARFQLTIKSSDAQETLLSCDFAIDNPTITVPEEFVSKLAQGAYLATFTYETHQVHYNDKGGYPPWVISAQDVIQFRLNKRL